MKDVSKLEDSIIRGASLTLAVILGGTEYRLYLGSLRNSVRSTYDKAKGKYQKLREYFSANTLS